MGATIKMLRDGRALTMERDMLYLAGQMANGASQVRALPTPKGDATHYLGTTAGAIGLTADEAARVARLLAEYRAEMAREREVNDAARRERERKARAYDNLYNEGGEGYNPHRR